MMGTHGTIEILVSLLIQRVNFFDIQLRARRQGYGAIFSVGRRVE